MGWGEDGRGEGTESGGLLSYPSSNAHRCIWGALGLPIVEGAGDGNELHGQGRRRHYIVAQAPHIREKRHELRSQRHGRVYLGRSHGDMPAPRIQIMKLLGRSSLDHTQRIAQDHPRDGLDDNVRRCLVFLLYVPPHHNLPPMPSLQRIAMSMNTFGVAIHNSMSIFLPASPSGQQWEGFGGKGGGGFRTKCTGKSYREVTKGEDSTPRCAYQELCDVIPQPVYPIDAQRCPSPQVLVISRRRRKRRQKVRSKGLGSVQRPQNHE